MALSALADLPLVFMRHIWGSAVMRTPSQPRQGLVSATPLGK